jgi:hypothetical protein
MSGDAGAGRRHSRGVWSPPCSVSAATSKGRPANGRHPSPPPLSTRQNPSSHEQPNSHGCPHPSPPLTARQNPKLAQAPSSPQSSPHGGDRAGRGRLRRCPSHPDPARYVLDIPQPKGPRAPTRPLSYHRRHASSGSTRNRLLSGRMRLGHAGYGEGRIRFASQLLPLDP